MDYNLNINKLFSNLALGTVVGEPRQLAGGHLHRVYAVETLKAKYAVKALNPQVMLRPGVFKCYIDSENIAELASKNVPACHALKLNGSYLQETDGQFYLIYPFIDAISLSSCEITPEHTVKIGAALAAVHTTDYSSLGLTDDYSSVEKAVDWSFYLHAGRETEAPWVNVMEEHIEKLCSWQRRFIAASAKLSQNTVISHGDLEPKNVLWQNSLPVIIDWEAAGFVHCVYDMFETAVYLSKKPDGEIDPDRFLSFCRGYGKNTSFPPFEPDAVLDRGFSLLGWLDYSLKRSLKIECADDAEQKLGTEHVFGTINMLLKYEQSLPLLGELLREGVK